MTIKMMGKLPQGDGNGLTAVETSLIHSMSELRLCVTILSTHHVSTQASGDQDPYVITRRIEPILDDDDAKVLAMILRRALDRRLGIGALPFDLEQDIREVFGDAWPTGPGTDPDPGATGEPGDPGPVPPGAE